MPWLSGTALVHSLAATEKRGVFRNWTVLLAILTFSLSLMGTFLVRSGILVSVHAFASDPTRGLFILGFLVFVVGGSLTLYALRASTIKPLSSFGLVSRESGILFNNLIMSVGLLVVLLGTLFPLIAVALDWGSYSVGPPYFNRMFVPLMLLLLAIIAFAPYLNWKKSNKLKSRWRVWSIVLAVSIASSVVMTGELEHRYDLPINWMSYAIAALIFWAFWMSLAHSFISKPSSQSVSNHLKRYSLSYWGMITAHCGFAITALGILYTVNYSQQSDLRMQLSDTADLSGLTFELSKLEDIRGPNYSAARATITVSSGERVISTLTPEKRMYHASRNVMTEAGIDWSIMRDLYVSLGEQLDNDSWSVRLYIKVYVRLIWLGSLLMALGSIMAIIGKRKHQSNDKSMSEVGAAHA
jgi:cytochrome c-type biogenesis protein CcmF